MSISTTTYPVFITTHLKRRLREARKALELNPCPETAHALARVAWKHSKLLLLEMTREKGL